MTQTKGKKYLTNAQEIIAAEDFRFVDVEVPEWGGTVRIRSLSAKQRDTLARKIKSDGEAEASEMMVVMCVVDENGQRVFEFKDIERLKAKSTVPIARIVRALGELTTAYNKSTEKYEENFAEIPNDDSLID